VGGGQLSARLLNASHPMGRSCKRSTALPDRLRPHVLVRPGRRLPPLGRARLGPVLLRGHLRRRRPRRILHGGTHPGLDGPGPRLARRPRRRRHTARTPWPRVDRRRAGEAGRGRAPLGGARPVHHQRAQQGRGPPHEPLPAGGIRPASGRPPDGAEPACDAPEATRAGGSPSPRRPLRTWTPWRDSSRHSGAAGSSPPRRHPGRWRTRSDARDSGGSAPTWRDATRTSPASSAPGTRAPTLRCARSRRR
jgi:hypothetical protein